MFHNAQCAYGIGHSSQFDTYDALMEYNKKGFYNIIERIFIHVLFLNQMDYLPTEKTYIQTWESESESESEPVKSYQVWVVVGTNRYFSSIWLIYFWTSMKLKK